MKEFTAGNTFKVEWVNSGTTPSALYFAAFTGSETVVESATMISSGNGHYYIFHTVANTPGVYMARTFATISSKPFNKYEQYRVVLPEV